MAKEPLSACKYCLCGGFTSSGVKKGPVSFPTPGNRHVGGGLIGTDLHLSSSHIKLQNTSMVVTYDSRSVTEAYLTRTTTHTASDESDQRQHDGLFILKV